MDQTPRIVLYKGPMFSSKTTELIGAIRWHASLNKNVVVLKFTGDQRYQSVNESQKIKSHSGLEYEAFVCSGTLSLPESVAKENIDVIAIDEGHFFSNLDQFCLQMRSEGKLVIVAALDLDSDGNPWGSVKELSDHCGQWPDQVIEKCSFCINCGCSAYYTKKINENNVRVDIGGAEKYSPVCLDHFIFTKK